MLLTKQFKGNLMHPKEDSTSKLYFLCEVDSIRLPFDTVSMDQLQLTRIIAVISKKISMYYPNLNTKTYLLDFFEP